MRHGESVFNRSGIWTGSADVPLTEYGFKQAQKAGESLKQQGLKFDLILSSPLERAHQTAIEVAKKLDYPIEKISLSNRLLERSFGELEGRRDLMAETDYQNSESAIDNYKNVEPLQTLQERANSFLNEAYLLPQETILVVGHGAFGRALYRTAYKLPADERGYIFENAEVVKLI